MTRKLTGNLTKPHSKILRAKRAKFQKMRILPPQIVKITSFFVKILRKFSKCKVLWTRSSTCWKITLLLKKRFFVLLCKTAGDMLLLELLTSIRKWKSKAAKRNKRMTLCCSSITLYWLLHERRRRKRDDRYYVQFLCKTHREIVVEPQFPLISGRILGLLCSLY